MRHPIVGRIGFDASEIFERSVHNVVIKKPVSQGRIWVAGTFCTGFRDEEVRDNQSLNIFYYHSGGGVEDQITSEGFILDQPLNV